METLWMDDAAKSGRVALRTPQYAARDQLNLDPINREL
jgi:hypothetical protein